MENDAGIESGPVGMPAPQAPFTGWPIQWVEPGLGYAWYVEPATLVVQAFVTHGTADAAGRYMDVIDRLIEAKLDDLCAAGGLTILLDWHLMQTYEPDARRLILERMKRRPKGYLRRTVACLPSTPLLKMAVQGVNLVAAFMGGASVELCDDAREAIEKHHINPPPPDASFPSP